MTFPAHWWLWLAAGCAAQRARDTRPPQADLTWGRVTWHYRAIRRLLDAAEHYRSQGYP